VKEMIAQQTRLGLKATGTVTQVPNAARAKLMYYLSCMTNVLGSDTADFKLVDYMNYDTLSQDETDALLILCLVLSPDKLLDKCIFCAPEMCGDTSNEFWELSEARSTLAVTETVIIGGETKRVFTRS
jgi:hypothetical protein